MYLLLQDVLDHARVRVRLGVDVGYDRDARLLHVDGVQHRAQLLVKKDTTTHPHWQVEVGGVRARRGRGRGGGFVSRSGHLRWRGQHTVWNNFEN